MNKLMFASLALSCAAIASNAAILLAHRDQEQGLISRAEVEAMLSSLNLRVQRPAANRLARPEAGAGGIDDPQIVYTSRIEEIVPNAPEGSGITALSGVVPDTTGVTVGVEGIVSSTQFASGVIAQSTATSGVNFGLVATNESPDGFAGFFGSVNGAKLISSSNGAFEVDANGNVSANAYTGDGSALTGVTAEIGDNTITTEKIVDGQVTRDDIALDAITSSRILDGSIGNVDLSGTAVTTDKIVNGTILSEDLANLSITTDKIVNGTILAEDLANLNITTVKIADGAVTGLKLAGNAVGSANIIDGAVALADLAANSVNGSKIVDGAIQTADIANSAVDSNKILNESITTADIQNGTIQGFDVDGWIYTKKTELYFRSHNVASGIEATATCDDANDLPLTWTFSSSADDFAATTATLENWTSTTDPAGVTVTRNNAGALSARIVCIPVP